MVQAWRPFLCSTLFESVVKIHFPVQPQDKDPGQIGNDALRYVAGYIIRNIKNKTINSKLKSVNKTEV